MMKNTEIEYGGVAKFFHWLIFLLILFNIVLGYIAPLFPKPSQGNLIYVHKINGLTILLLVILRLVWALINIKPKPPSLTSLLEKIAVKTVHGLMYVAMFFIPISGWIFSTAAGYPPTIFGIKFGFPGIPKSKVIDDIGFDIHATFVIILLILIGIHLLASLKHHFYDRDGTFLRMLPFYRRKP